MSLNSAAALPQQGVTMWVGSRVWFYKHRIDK
jgi:hypothetical protein